MHLLALSLYRHTPKQSRGANYSKQIGPRGTNLVAVLVPGGGHVSCVWGGGGKFGTLIAAP